MELDIILQVVIILKHLTKIFCQYLNFSLWFNMKFLLF
jgi:hypothetical protein